MVDNCIGYRKPSQTSKKLAPHSCSQCEGLEFDSPWLHHFLFTISLLIGFTSLAIMGVASLALGMRSLDQLGIRLDWDFHFLNKGQHAEPMPNQILVDAGGTLDTGVIDVHQGDTKYESLVRAVAENPHLVLNHLLHGLNSEYAAGRSPQINEITFTFCTHSGPGWDSMAALYLCDELLRHGKLPDDIHWLLDASDQIAQAKVKTGGATNRPFIIYYAIAALRKTDKEQLLAGLNLIQKIIECARTGKIQTNGKNPF